MRLAIFDIDGTLTRSGAVDGECFVEALRAEVGAFEINRQWYTYDHVTDPGIMRQVFVERLGRPPTADDVQRVQHRFVGLLDAAVAQRPDSCTAVPGAVGVLEALRRHGWQTAIATGSWRAAALLKLDRAGIDAADVPAAFADDAPGRHDIVNTALARAQTHYRSERFTRVVALGDAVWDVRAARQLALPFVGIRYDGDAARLRKHGVRHVLTDFTDVDAVLTALHEAAVPEAPDPATAPVSRG